MNFDNILRRLRGALGTALVWGVGGFVLAMAALSVFAVLSVVGIISGGFSWIEALVLGVRAGIASAVAGVGFSTLIGLLYRGRRLSELSWVRFGIVGGLAAGLFVPLFLQTMNLLSGDGLVPWALVLDDGLRMLVFGGVLASGSLKLAQIGERLLPAGSQDQLDPLEGVDRPALEGEGDSR